MDQHAVAGCLPMKMLDGLFGLVPHWTDTEALVDVYNDVNALAYEKRVPFARIKDAGHGALVETKEEDDGP